MSVNPINLFVYCFRSQNLRSHTFIRAIKINNLGGDAIAYHCPLAEDFKTSCHYPQDL